LIEPASPTPSARGTSRLSSLAIVAISIAALVLAFVVGQSFAVRGGSVPDALVSGAAAPTDIPETNRTIVPSTTAATTSVDPAGATASRSFVVSTEDAGPTEDARVGAPTHEVASRGPSHAHKRAPARPVEADVGVLVVTTPGGWADVYADGRRLGRTPLTTSLPTGRVSLELRPFTQSLPDDPRAHPTVTIGTRITTVSVPLGSNGQPR
jgi:hypothetical protein